MRPWLIGLVVIALLAVLAAEGSAVPADRMKCAACGKSISGGVYVEAGGKVYHAKCFVCANCGKAIPAAHYYEHDHKIYDSTCYAELFKPKCAYCGNTIDGDYVTYLGNKYHSSCYSLHVALRCDLCGKIIEGPYFVDFFGNKIHESHKGTAPRCDYCGRFISEKLSRGGRMLPDGRRVCGYCGETMVSSQHEADSLMGAVKALLAEAGIVINHDELPLVQVDRNRMRQIAPADRPDALGFTYYKRSSRLYGLYSKREFTIYTLDRLPRIEFITTAAHELMHVWLGLNAPFPMNDTLAEGSCNFAAYLILKRFDSQGAYIIDKMMKDDNPVYGAGFRAVGKYVEANGVSKWLEYLRQNAQPWW